MGPAQGSGSCQCASSFSLILRSAMVSSAGAGFSFFSSSMRSDPRAFLRAAALAAPSRRVGRVFGFEFLVSSWEPGSGSRGWVPAPYRVRGRLFAGTTAVGAGTTDELGSGWAEPSAVLRTGLVRAELAGVLRPPPPPWVPASAGTTVELGSGCTPALLGRATPRPWVPAFAGTTIELSGFPSACAGTTDELGSGCTPALLGRATPRPWVPAFAGTTIVLSGFPSACAGTTYESPSPQPSPVKG